MKRLHKNNSTREQRDAQKEAVADTVRDWLDQQDSGYTISTRELSILLSPDDPYVAVQILTAIAKKLAKEGFVRRGEKFKNKWGKVIRPNIWGVCEPNEYDGKPKAAPVEDATLPDDALPSVPKKKNSAQILEEWKAKNAARRQQG